MLVRPALLVLLASAACTRQRPLADSDAPTDRTSASATAPRAPAQTFPLADPELRSLLPSETGCSEPGSLCLIGEANGQLVGASLPFIATLARRTPALRVLVVDSSGDARLASWLVARRFVRLDPTSTLQRRLERLAEHEPFERFLRQGTSPAPGMADGLRGEPQRVYLFRGPALIWVGSASNAKPVLEHAARGTWSVERLEQYERIRGELGEYVKLASAGKDDQARALAGKLAARDDAQPSRLTDLAHAMTAFLQTPEDIELARRLARRAVQLTERLDADILSAAATALQLAGDNAGSVAAAERVLELCRAMKTDCEGEALALSQLRRCPSRLVEAPPEPKQRAQRSRYTLERAQGAAPDCP